LIEQTENKEKERMMEIFSNTFASEGIDEKRNDDDSMINMMSVPHGLAIHCVMPHDVMIEPKPSSGRSQGLVYMQKD
jgi:hypothetical protein